MKLITSLYLLLTPACYAFIQIDYFHVSQAESVSNIFQTKYSIPKNLIHLRNVQNCQHMGNKKNIAHLCVNKKGELRLLSYKKDMIVNSLSIFKDTKE